MAWLGAKRYGELWRDPARTIRTLESFAETEADGARDIATARERTAEPWLETQFEHHAADEWRHAELFRARARELRAEHPEVAAADRDPRFDLSRGRRSAEVDAHGFFVSGLMEELGDLAYVAMLHVAEKRAAKLFREMSAATRHDPATRRIFEEILKDERFHVAYTKNALEHWRKRGRGKDVSDALSAARGNRFLGAWRRLGLRAAGGFGRAVLWVAYFTLFLPFGLVARWTRPRAGFQAPARAGSLRSQY
jgi:bacterioferritin (cytochrome b1)